jgi:hypothetical protein
MKEIYLDLLVSLCNAKDYVRGFLRRESGAIAIDEYDPRIGEIAVAWERRVAAIVTGLPILWVGSSALKIPGRPDIDLVVECDASRIDAYVASLSELLGRSIERTRKYVRWSKREREVTVDVLLVDPAARLYRRMTESYRLLLTNPALLEEYKEIKRGSHGLSHRQYEYRRDRFFNKLFFKYGSGANLFGVTTDGADEPHRA